MEELEAMEEDGRMAALPKKEQILLRKELGKLQANLNGVRHMNAVPDAVFVVDTKREEIAIREAHRLGIPVIGIIDTNADPDEVDFGIPGNDDAIRSVNLMCEVIADAIIAGSTGGGITAADMEAPAAEVAEEIAAEITAEIAAEIAAAAPEENAAEASDAPADAPADVPDAGIVEEPTAEESPVEEPIAEEAAATEEIEASEPEPSE